MIVNPALVGPEATSWSVELNDDPDFFDDWQDADVVVRSAEKKSPELVELVFQTGARVPANFIANVLWWVVADKMEYVKSAKIGDKGVRLTERALKNAVRRAAGIPRK